MKGEIQAAVTARVRVPMRSTGAEMPGEEEGPVMGLDRRGVVIRFYSPDNPQGDDLYG